MKNIAVKWEHSYKKSDNVYSLDDEEPNTLKRYRIGSDDTGEAPDIPG
jgi:hypothetical protein